MHARYLSFEAPTLVRRLIGSTREAGTEDVRAIHTSAMLPSLFTLPSTIVNLVNDQARPPLIDDALQRVLPACPLRMHYAIRFFALAQRYPSTPSLINSQANQLTLRLSSFQVCSPTSLALRLRFWTS